MEKEVARLEMGEVTPPPLKKVAIVGFSNHKTEAPYNDPTFEIWGLNDLHESIPRWNRWFEMHSDKQIKDYCSRKQGVPYLEGLAKLGVPVYMQKVRPEVPTSVEYPIERMKAQFGDYFTNSISYMLAMAIDEGYQVIHVYGVDMAQDCLAPEMRVLTADLLWVPVGDLKVGDELLAFDEEPPVRNGGPERAQFRKYRKTRVESLSRIMRPCHSQQRAFRATGAFKGGFCCAGFVFHFRHLVAEAAAVVVGLSHGLCRFKCGIKAEQPVWLVVRIVLRGKTKLGQQGL